MQHGILPARYFIRHVAGRGRFASRIARCGRGAVSHYRDSGVLRHTLIVSRRMIGPTDSSDSAQEREGTYAARLYKSTLTMGAAFCNSDARRHISLTISRTVNLGHEK